MKDCKKIHPLLSLYLEGELSARENKAVRRHLSSCPEARKELVRLKKLKSALKRLPEPRPPRDLHEKIMARLRGRGAVRGKVLEFNWPIGLTAAAAALALFVLVQYPHWTGPSSPTALSAPQGRTLAMKKEPIGSTVPSAPKNLDVVQNYAPATSVVNSERERPLMMARKAKIEERPMAALGPRAMNASAPPAAAAPPQPDGSTLQGAEVPEESVTNVTDRTLQSSNPMAAALPTVFANATPVKAPLSTDMAAKVQMAFGSQQAQTVWSGSFSPVTVESQLVVTDPVSWKAQWDSLQPGQPLPTVDFTAKTVLILNAGNQPTTGWSIQVTKLEDSPNQLIVHYQVIAPAPGAVTGQMVTRPWVIQVITQPSKPVTFIRDPS